MGWINTKFKATCRACKVKLAIGTEVYWDKFAKSVTCRACKAAPSATLATADVFKRESAKTTNPANVWVDAYENIGALKARCAQAIHPGSAHSSGVHELHPDADRIGYWSSSFWAGETSARSAWHSLQHGWPKGLEQADRLLEMFPSPRVPGKRRRRVWAEDGADFDRDRWAEGREDYWQATRVEQSSSGRLSNLRIVVQGNVAGFRDAADYIWSGLVATALCDAIETVGVRVQLDVCFPSENWWSKGPRVAGPLVTVKQADEPLDRSRIIAWTGHPAAHRVVAFRWATVSGPENGCYGRNTQAVDDFKNALGLDEASIYVHRIFEREAALDFVHAELTRLGIEWD